MYSHLWRRRWQITPVFLPGKPHGQRILVSYSSWDRKESDTTGENHTFLHISMTNNPHQQLETGHGRSISTTETGKGYDSGLELNFCRFPRLRNVKVAQPCPTLCDPIDCSPPGSSVHGISQTRVLEWGAIEPSKKGATSIQNCPTSTLLLFLQQATTFLLEPGAGSFSSSSCPLIS